MKKRKPTDGKTSVSALTGALDRNPEIRAALVARIVKAAEKVPVVMLHQIAMMLDMAADQF